MATKGISLRLDESTLELVNNLAKMTERDPSFLMRKAIENYAEHEGWIIKETQRRMALLANKETTLIDHDTLIKELNA